MSLPAERYCPSCERSFHEGTRCPTDGTELVVIAAPERDPLVGRSLNDRYTIQEKLGAGGMGTVYRGLQHSVGRDVAIKVVNAALVTNPDVIKRFLREAKLSSRLSHPNAVSILDFGQTTDGLFYLVMELLSGRTLDNVLKLEGRFRLARLVRTGGQICEALEGAHRLPIVHRDLKPANIILLEGTEGRDLVKVLDFGLAKSLSPDTTGASMTMSGALLGTPAYMSPEAARGDEVDERGDLYSLGCILYALASGRPPFTSETMHELLSMHSSATPAPLTMVPPPVAAVIMRLLAKDPVDRFRTAAATRHALEEAALPFISSDIATAVANTLPGRRKSMPPQAEVARTAETVQTMAPRPVTAKIDAIAETITPATPVALQVATPAPAIAATPTAPVTPLPDPTPPRRSRALPWLLAAGGLAIGGGVLAVVLGSSDPSEPSQPAAPASTSTPSTSTTPPSRTTPQSAVTPPAPPVLPPDAAVAPVEAKPVEPASTDAKPTDTKPTDTKPSRPAAKPTRPTTKPTTPAAKPTTPPEPAKPPVEPPKPPDPAKPKTTPW